MADPSLIWKAIAWRILSIAAGFIALAEALNGHSECFLWMMAGFLEWNMANYYADRMKGDENGRTDGD